MDFNSKRKLQKDISKALKNGKFHKFTRNFLISTIATSSILGGLALTSNSKPSTVNLVVDAKAAKKKAVKTNSKAAKVKKTSAIYNSKGKRVGKKSFKKGKKFKVYGIKTIKGKKYYSLGHGKYILASHVTLAKTVILTKTSYLYNSKGKRIGKKSFKKGKKFKVYGTKTIKGKKYYSLGNGIYVPVAQVKAPVETPSNTPTPNTGSSTGSGDSTGSSTGSGDSTNPSTSTATTAAASVASAVRPGMTDIYHGLSDLSGKLNDPKYQDVKNDIKDVLAKIKDLPTTWTDTNDMINEIAPILKDTMDIAQKVEGSGVKTDLVTVLHGLEKVDKALGPDQINNLKNVYAALENINATSKTRKDIKELAQGLHPDLSNVYHDLEAIKSEVPADKYQGIKNDVKDIISGTKEMPANFDWSKLNEPDHVADEDVQSVLNSFTKIYNATKDIATKLQGTGVKTNLVKLLTDTEHINTTLKADDSKLLTDVRDLDSNLENYSGTDETINKAKGLAVLTHSDLAKIYYALDKITTAQINTAAINSAIDDALGKVETLPSSGNDLLINIVFGESTSEIAAIKGIYEDLRTISSNLEGKGIKTQLVIILHSLEALNQKVAQNTAQIQNLKDIYNNLQNGNFTWLNDLN